jgi:hypothetical protein
VYRYVVSAWLLARQLLARRPRGCCCRSPAGTPAPRCAAAGRSQSGLDDPGLWMGRIEGPAGRLLLNCGPGGLEFSPSSLAAVALLPLAVLGVQNAPLPPPASHPALVYLLLCAHQRPLKSLGAALDLPQLSLFLSSLDPPPPCPSSSLRVALAARAFSTSSSLSPPPAPQAPTCRCTWTRQQPPPEAHGLLRRRRQDAGARATVAFTRCCPDEVRGRSPAVREDGRCVCSLSCPSAALARGQGGIVGLRPSPSAAGSEAPKKFLRALLRHPPRQKNRYAAPDLVPVGEFWDPA